MSGTAVRRDDEGNRSAPITNLIIHHGVADIFDQMAEFVRILDVGKKTLHLYLLFQWLEFLEDVFQFPNGPYMSTSTRDHGRSELTVPIPPSSLPPGHHLQKRGRRVK
jgi:hypothetical protein